MPNWIVLYGTLLNSTLWSLSLTFLPTRTCIFTLNRLWKCFTVKLFPVQTHCICIDVISGATEKQPEHSQAFQCFLRPEPATPRVWGGSPRGSLRASLWIAARGAPARDKRDASLLYIPMWNYTDRAQLHSLWSSSSGSGTVWYKIAGRPSGLCKQPHSTCNGEERNAASQALFCPASWPALL